MTYYEENYQLNMLYHLHYRIVCSFFLFFFFSLLHASFCHSSIFLIHNICVSNLLLENKISSKNHMLIRTYVGYKCFEIRTALDVVRRTVNNSFETPGPNWTTQSRQPHRLKLGFLLRSVLCQKFHATSHKDYPTSIWPWKEFKYSHLHIWSNSLTKNTN